MIFQQLQTLQEALPILLRHLGAYAELAEKDMAIVKQRVVARLQAGVIVLFGAFFSLLMLCMLLLGATWDTQYRLIAIGSLAAGFIAVTIIAAVVASRSKSVGAFDSVRREWRQDRQIIERVFVDKKHAASTQAQSDAYADERAHAVQH